MKTISFRKLKEPETYFEQPCDCCSRYNYCNKRIIFIETAKIHELRAVIIDCPNFDEKK